MRTAFVLCYQHIWVLAAQSCNVSYLSNSLYIIVTFVLFHRRWCLTCLKTSSALSHTWSNNRKAYE